MIGFEPCVKEFLHKNNLTLKYAADGKDLLSPDYLKLLDVLLKAAISQAVTKGEFTMKDSFTFHKDGTIEVREKVANKIRTTQGKLITDTENFLEELLGTNITRLI